MSALQKLWRGLQGRRGTVKRLRANAAFFARRPFWFHFASSGEFEQCVPLLEELRGRQPDAPIFLTYFSPSGERAVALETSRRTQLKLPLVWDQHAYAPIDLPWVTKRFVRLVQPRAYTVLHREIWPSVLRALRKQQVPCYLLGAYFPTVSFSLKFYRRFLRLFRYIGTVEESSREAIERVAPGLAVDVLGDPRIDRVLARKNRVLKPVWAEFFAKNLCFVGASVWEEDWRVLGPVLKDATQDFGNLRLLIVPHEIRPRFIKGLKENPYGLAFRLWSHWRSAPDDTSHLIVDEVGFLAELYRIASIAFVGGSYRQRVHNVLEPAAHGCPILVGPRIETSREAQEMARQGKGLVVCSNELAFRRELYRWLENPTLRLEHSQAASQYLLERSGVAQRCLDRILA